jgi:hypothetical protein
VTLTEEYRLRVFENKVLRRILGPKGKQMRYEELHNFYSSVTIGTYRMHVEQGLEEGK